MLHDDINSEADNLFRWFQTLKFDPKRSVPQVSMTIDIDIKKSEDIRRKFNESLPKHESVSLTHVLIKAVALKLIEFPLLFSLFDRSKAVISDKVRINLPIAHGNHVEYCVIDSPESKSLVNIAYEVRAEQDRISNNKGTFKVNIQRLLKIPVFLRSFIAKKIIGSHINTYKSYGNFPITNFGSFKVKNGVPIIMSPITGAMCLGLVNNFLLPVTLVFDHRIIDGAYGGNFLNSLKELLEKEPQLLFI
jgi:pyruvate/2-oxoglutarate dehydrogenase complex dihydrolipoamide acyltransferase (E2) component